MPFCQRCGCKLEDTARFCPSCGQAVASGKEMPANIEEKIKGFLQITPEMEQEQMEAWENPAPPAGNLKNRHFREQFARINAGKPLELKYNLFSMVFGPFQQLYHKSYSLFAKTYLPVMLLLAIDAGLSAYAGLTFDPTLLTISLALNGIGLFWGLGVAILNGKNYVHALYKQTDGNADAIPASPLSVVLGCVILAASIGLSNWLGYSLAMEQWEDELQNFPAYTDQETMPQDGWSEDALIATTIIMPNDYVVAPAETPWYGVWQDPVRGYRFTYEESLNYCSEQAQQLEGGSYQIRQTDNYDDSLFAQYICAADGTTLEEYDAAGTFLTSYSRPDAPDGTSLPRDWWGIYTLVSDSSGLASSTLTIDAYQFGGYLYTELEQLDDQTFKFFQSVAPDGWYETARYDAAEQTIALLDDTGTVYALYHKAT
ncbi:hypothetical protein B5E65_05460 [Gemmiger sp. An120]|uniref:zinc ribbon domain-containing protein n=1 Tax=Gemmiger sp. An120 TaxID=1965549 RepID=UPI000B377465|nr:zinc ribbon domain-containing protein [Gemmiger sp. An120]OUQ43222.1 hypothetical protein B5E65_05460 [Gemmiger sp. An120]